MKEFLEDRVGNIYREYDARGKKKPSLQKCGQYPTIVNKDLTEDMKGVDS